MDGARRVVGGRGGVEVVEGLGKLVFAGAEDTRECRGVRFSDGFAVPAGAFGVDFAEVALIHFCWEGEELVGVLRNRRGKGSVQVHSKASESLESAILSSWSMNREVKCRE